MNNEETEIITSKIKFPKKKLDQYAGTIDALYIIFLNILRETIDKDIIYV